MVQYIEYKEKKYPVRISYRALVGLKKDTGKSFEELSEGGDLEFYEPLLYHALISGAKAVDTEMPFKLKDMPDILDECWMSFSSTIGAFFPSDEEVEEGGEEGNFQPKGNRAVRRKKK